MNVSDPDALLRQIANDVQRGIASHALPLDASTLARLSRQAMPAAVDLTLRGYPMAAFDIGRNSVPVEMRTAFERQNEGDVNA